MDPQKILYYGKSKAVGGREGHAAAASGDFDMKLSIPKEMGGTGGEGSNPEELFAAGYAACFLSAMKVAALQSDPDVGGVELLWNVLVAIGVPCRHLEQDHLFRPRLIAARHQRLQ